LWLTEKLHLPHLFLERASPDFHIFWRIDWSPSLSQMQSVDEEEIAFVLKSLSEEAFQKEFQIPGSNWGAHFQAVNLLPLRQSTWAWQE
jgi:hypothetical protein